MKPSIRLLSLACTLAILPLGTRASVNETNNQPGYVMYVLVGHHITCGSYYESNFTCDHYLNYAVPPGESVVFNDHPEGDDCYHTYYVANITWIPVGSGASLSRADTQAYSGTDIFPNICTNSQPAYKEARWKVSLPNGATATLSANNGVSLSKTSNIVNNDVITVTAGSATGTYTLTLTPSSGSSVNAQGTVFAFEFSGTVDTSNYAPQGSTNGGLFDGATFDVEVAHDTSAPGRIETHLSYAGREANVSRTTKVKLVTNPSGAFSGSVNGTLKVDTYYSPYAILRKDSSDEGPTVSFSVSPLPWLSLSGPGGGYLQAASVKAAGQITINGGSTTTYGAATWATTDFQVPALWLYRTEAFGGLNITRTEVDSTRTYAANSTEINVRTEIGMVGYCTSNTATGTRVDVGNAAGQSNLSLSAQNEFAIQ